MTSIRSIAIVGGGLMGAGIAQVFVAAGKLGFKSGVGFRSWSKTEMEELRRRLQSHLIQAQRHESMT